MAGDLISLGLQGGQEKKAAWGQPLPGEAWGPSGPHWPWFGFAFLLGRRVSARDGMFSAGKDGPFALSSPPPALQVLNHFSCHRPASSLITATLWNGQPG